MTAAVFTFGALPLHAVEKAVDTGKVASSATVAFNVYVPLQNRAALDAQIAALHDSGSPQYHHWLTPAQFAALYAPSAAQIAQITKQLTSYGLTVTAVSGNRLHVSGTAAAAQMALTTTLHTGMYKSGRQTVMSVQPVSITGAMASTGAVVTGLSGMIRMHSFARKSAVPQNRYSTTGGYWFDDLKQAYSFPSYQAYTGKGTTIGILMSGDYNAPDMAQYFGHEKLATPNFSTVQIDGGAPFDPNGDSFETHLDLQ